MTVRARRKWDAFISHAGEDNAAVVIPLTEMLLSGELKSLGGLQGVRGR